MDASASVSPRRWFASRAGWRTWQVFLLYAVLAIVFNHQIVFNLCTATYAPADTSMMMWNLWWAKKALLDLKTNPFFTFYLFYPTGTSLVFHAPTLLYGVASIPIQCAVKELPGLVMSYNLTALVTFALSGLAAYLLVFHVTKDRLAAFISGIIFAFCPYRFCYATTLATVSTQWIAFFVYYVVRLVEKPRWIDALVASVFIFCASQTEPLYAYYMAIFVCLFSAYYILIHADREKRRRCLQAGVLILAFSVVALLPLVLLSTTAYLQGSSPEIPPLESSVRGSADLAGFVIPFHNQSFYGKYFDGINAPFAARARTTGGMGGREVFLGFTTIALLIYAFIRARALGKGIWIACALSFLILSLGPYLHVYGKLYDQYPLPYMLLYKYAPLFRIARSPSRFLIVAMLCAVVVIGSGLHDLFERLGRWHHPWRRSRPWLAATIALLVIVDLYHVTSTTWRVEVPSVYYDLGKDGEDYVVSPLPQDHPFVREYHMLCQTVMDKPIDTGYIARMSTKGVVMNPSLPESIERIRKYLRDPECPVRYVVVLKPGVRDAKRRLAELGTLHDFLSEHLTLVREDERTVLYRMPKQSPNWSAD